MGQGSHVAQLQRTHEQRSDKDRTLKKAFIEIGIMCERLSLPEAVKERASEVYLERTSWKTGRARAAIWGKRQAPRARASPEAPRTPVPRP